MAKQSLFAKQQEPAPAPTGIAVVIPGMSGMQAIAPPEPSGPSSAYVWFAGAKSPKWAEFVGKHPGLQQGEAFLILPDADAVRLGTSITYYLLDAMKYFASLNGEADGYSVKRAYREKPENVEKVREFLSTLLLVQTPQGIVPATMRASDAMCQGVYTSVTTATVDAQSPDWVTRSAEHAVTANIPDPRFRFKTVLTWKPRKSRTGNTYQISKASIVPSSIADALAVKSATEAPDFAEAMSQAKESFDGWKQEIESKM